MSLAPSHRLAQHFLTPPALPEGSHHDPLQWRGEECLTPLLVVFGGAIAGVKL